MIVVVYWKFAVVSRVTYCMNVITFHV